MKEDLSESDCIDDFDDDSIGADFDSIDGQGVVSFSVFKAGCRRITGSETAKRRPRIAASGNPQNTSRPNEQSREAATA